VSTWPITLDDVRDAARRLAPHLVPTPLRHYAPLDAAVGHGITVLTNIDAETLRRVVTRAA